MIPLTKRLTVEAIASLCGGTIEKPKQKDDMYLIVSFTCGDDKRSFVEAWNKAKPRDMRLVKSGYGLIAKVECC